MKKLAIILSAVICGFTAVYSQDAFFTAPNYKQIERNVKDTSSPYYYPNLLERYLDGDSTFNTEERRHVYFGYVYQSQYIPSDTSEYNGKLAEILSKQSFTAQDYNNILLYADALLQEDPFNLRALNAKLLVYAQQNSVPEYMKVMNQRKIVQDAIVSTGDGMSEKTPFYVIKVAHEYDLLGFLGYKFGGSDKIVKNCNYLTLAPNRFGVERVYFEISPVLKHASTRQGGKL